MAERPVECSHCKRPIQVIYKELVGDTITCTEMCAECPLLEQRLHGQVRTEGSSESLKEGETGLCCGNCRTTLESVQTGNPLGCSECYAVFADVLVAEMIDAELIPKSMTARKNQPLHIGKAPHISLSIPSSSRLTALNEALNEALKKENYEQAAWLRDQIKELQEKGPDDGKA